MRYVFGFLGVFPLILMLSVGCSEGGGEGGSGGTAGTGGMAGTGGAGGSDLCAGIVCEDDGNECTGDGVCDPADGMCDYPSVEDGVACDESNECTAGQCASGACDAAPVADGTACGGDAGTCQQGNCRVACTEQGIRDAIAAGGGPYTFDCDGPTTVVTEAEVVIDNDVILDGEGSFTVDGNDDHTVFRVDSTVELRGVAVTKGRGRAGGIFNQGTLTLINSTVFGNTGNVAGGIESYETLTLTNTTVSDNTTGDYLLPEGGPIAGGIQSYGTLTVINSTVSGNTSRVIDGIANIGTLTVANSTLYGNDIWSWNDTERATLTNSLVVDGGCDRVGEPNLSGGHNIESPGDTCDFDQSTDQVNVGAEQLALQELADNGGPTETHALDVVSVAIDVIPEEDCVDGNGEPLTTDQRGFPRPVGDGCDVGAFEVQP